MQQVIGTSTEQTSERPVLRPPRGIPEDGSSQANSAFERPPLGAAPLDKLASATAPSSTGTAATIPPAMSCPPSTESVEKPLQLAWQELPPDGSKRNAELVLMCLEKHFGVKLFVSVGPSLERLMILTANSNHYEENTAEGNRIKNALREACSPAGCCRFALPSGQTSLLLKQVLEDQDSALVVLGFSLDSANAAAKGPKHASVILLDGSRKDTKSAADYAQTVDAIRRILAPWLEVWWLSQCGLRWQRTLGKISRWTVGRRKAVLATLAVFFVSLWVPVPYWPKRDCVLEPAKKSFIAGPIDGILKDIAVRPGDAVTQGTLLARLDDEPIQWDLSAAQADMQSAGKRRDSALASRNSSDLRLAQLEQEKQRATIASLEKQLQDLDLRSPVDGVIVQGSLDEHNGMPVSRGETLFEIAPLDRMRLEVHLSTADLANIEVGQRVTLRVDANRWKQWSANITRIAPRAKVIDSEVVFIATAEIENPDKILRPGMDGTVRISAGTKTIGWLIFSKPYEWLLSKLYW